MPHIEGKTINELLRVEDVTGAEIIPMSVYSEEFGSYVTRGITVDNFFKIIYGMIKDADEKISYIQDDMSAYVDELRAYDAMLHEDDVRLDNELQKTNAYVSYHAEDLILLHEHYHRITSYSYENIGELWEANAYGDSYAYEQVGKLWDEANTIHAYSYEGVGKLEDGFDSLQSYAYENVGYLGEIIITKYDELDDKISYEHDWTLSYMATSYDKLDKAIAYVAAYAEGGSGYLAYQLEELHAYSYENIAKLHEDVSELHSYAYEGVGKNSYINFQQDITLMHHEDAIGAVARAVSYESYVNTIQSGHINTIYYENSDDAFNDWSNPDDDNVKPQS